MAGDGVFLKLQNFLLIFPSDLWSVIFAATSFFLVIAGTACMREELLSVDQRLSGETS